MALKAFVNSLDNVPESQKDMYKEREEGGYVLDVESVGPWALEDVGGLKEVLSSTREKLRKTREQVEAFGDLTPDKARDAMTKVEEMANWTPEEKVHQQIRQREQQLLERHNTELSKKDETLIALKRALEKSLVQTAARQAIDKHKGIPELLLPAVERTVRMVQTADGEFAAQVMSEDGQTPRISNRTGSTDPMSIDEFVENLKQDPSYGRAFEGSGQSGSGATFGDGGPKGKGRVRSHDQDTLNRNIADIAAGKVVVQD